MLCAKLTLIDRRHSSSGNTVRGATKAKHAAVGFKRNCLLKELAANSNSTRNRYAGAKGDWDSDMKEAASFNWSPDSDQTPEPFG